MGAWQLRAYLNEVRPEVVLIEGLSDANDLIPDMTRQATRPPIAILAYTDSLPVRTLVYPLATYSPEYQAIRWAKENDAVVKFIDLSSEHFLGLQDLEAELLEKARSEKVEREKEPPSESEETPELTSGVPEPRRSLYERCAELAGESDYETYWERHYEHNATLGSYQRASYEFGSALRDLEEDAPRWRAENLVREALMRRRVEETIATGHKPERMVVIVGAFHAPVMSGEFPSMTDGELD